MADLHVKTEDTAATPDSSLRIGVGLFCRHYNTFEAPDHVCRTLMIRS